MKTKKSSAAGVAQGSEGSNGGPGLDAQLGELLEFVFTCERIWRLEERVDNAIKYGPR